MILAAEFLAIPSSAVKIASERRCAILVHSVGYTPKAFQKQTRLQEGLLNASRNLLQIPQGPRGGFKRGGFPDLDFSFRFWSPLSLFVLSGTFPTFPGSYLFWVGFSQLVLFLFLRLLSWLKRTCEEQSRKGLRHNPDLSRKKWETPRFGNPPRSSFSQFSEPPANPSCQKPWYVNIFGTNSESTFPCPTKVLS